MASASQKTTSPSSSPCCPPRDSSGLAVVAAAAVKSDRIPNTVALIRPLDSESPPTNVSSAKGITTYFPPFLTLDLLCILHHINC